jgi:hypothetical protein
LCRGILHLGQHLLQHPTAAQERSSLAPAAAHKAAEAAAQESAPGSCYSIQSLTGGRRAKRWGASPSSIFCRVALSVVAVTRSGLLQLTLEPQCYLQHQAQ